MVYVSLIYPPELGQLIDAATRANRPPADLFEALRMVGVSPHFETVFDELHESEI